MYKWGVIIWALLFFPFVNDVKAQSISNEGTDFWSVFPSHVPSPDPITRVDRLANITIFVTSKYETEVTVSCGTYSQTQPVPANVAVSFDVPRDLSYINVAERNVSLSGRGIHIKVTDGKPAVSAYAHIYAGQRSAASLILPYETLGQKYYSMNYTQPANGNNFLVLVAADDDTHLRIHKKDGTLVAVNLAKAGDAYEYISGLEDLTGTFVDVDPILSQCKRFAAFSGSTAMELGGCVSKSYDPLYQQLYTISSWGKNYGVVPFIDRKYILRVMAQEDNTTFTYNGNTQVIPKAGDYAELGPFTTSTFISADKLISVAEYSLTQSCSGADGRSIEGDPEMVMLNPIEFSIKKVTVFSSILQAINHRYINVLIKENRAQSFRINGLKPAVTWQPLNGNAAYVYAQIEVTDRSLNLTADEGFNVIAYGFGNAESYAYSAGTNLSSNNYLSVVSLTGDRTEYPNACVGEKVDFKIALPYEVNRIQWTLDGVLKEEIGLVPEVRMVNGEKVFIYTLMAGKQYLTAGHHEMDVETSIAANTGSCIAGNISTVYSFDVYDLPTAKFEMAPSGCEKTELVFTDKSNSNTPDFPISEWLWDFGDGHSSTEQNPKHTYAAVGTYTVRLSVKSGVVCASDPSPPQDIVIHPLPTAKFKTATSTTCINTNLLFTDESTIPTNEVIVKWTWNFAGEIVERTNNLPFTHSFGSTGTKQVTLVTTSSNGCLSVPETKSIGVVALPQAQFELPAFCLADGTATFNNKAVNSDGTTISGLTYLWNFGDPISINNTSTAKDGQHVYTATGKYQVTLTVTNENGCENVLTQEFTVNGAVKSAGFTVQNENNLCSDKDVLINNTSEAYFGSITKIEIYKDFLNNPSDMQIIMYPTAADIHLTYPSFGGNDSKSYTIHMIAYSGMGCNMTFDKVITVYPSPVLAFAPIPDVCENDGLIPLTQASEESGMIGGTGVYSGAFVSAGVFNAKTAKAGVHPVTFTYTALNGCPASITRNITVYKSPEANAGETIYMLAGGYAKMHATASTGATYLWSPSVGLENPSLLNPSIFPAVDTKYTLTVSTDHCTATSEVWVRVLQELKPSNAFSPNGDNINDTWEIKYLNSYPNAMVQIFNRYGQIVFTSHGYAVPFDGNYQGNPLPVGTYYYIITPNNGRQKITGSLTLIR